MLLLLCSYVITAHGRSLIEPQFEDNEFYSETFTLFADFADGQYLYGQIGISNLGPGDKNGLCRIMLYNAQKKVVNKSVVLKNAGWTFSRQAIDKLTVGACSLVLNKNNLLIFNGSIDNKHLEIQLRLPKNQMRTPDGSLNFKNGHYKAHILTPWSQATATINKNKNNLVGYGYADHSISTLLPSQIAQRWIRFRAINDGNSHLFLIRYPKDAKNPKGWLWKEGASQQPVVDVSGLFVGKPSFNIKANMTTYTIQANKLIFRQAPLENKGIFGKILSQIMGNPVTYTYRATMKTQKNIEISGILEVAFADDMQ